MNITYTWCGHEIPGIILLRDLKAAVYLIVVKLCLCMFQLAPVMISKHSHELCGSCGADKTCVFLRLVTKMSDGFLEQ
jgi:hypothetical protein